MNEGSIPSRGTFYQLNKMYDRQRIYSSRNQAWEDESGYLHDEYAEVLEIEEDGNDWHTYYLPTHKRLKECEGRDWY